MEYIPFETVYEEIIVYCKDNVCTEVETDKLVLIVNPKDGFMTVQRAKEEVRYEQHRHE